MSEDGSGSTSSLVVRLVDEQETEVDQRRLKEVARRTAAGEGAAGELWIYLVDEQRISDLNSQYLDEQGPTDVISFPVDGLVRRDPAEGPKPPALIGEVVVCPAFALMASEAFSDPSGELDLIVAHGVLHLLGYDHDTDDAARRMRSREIELVGRAGAEAP